MRNRLIGVLPLALVMATAACGGSFTIDSDKDSKSGARDAAPVTTRGFALNGFTGVKVTRPDDVTIRQGDAFAITAKGPQGELDQLEIVTDGSTLSIGRKRDGFSFGGRDHEGVEISITMPNWISPMPYFWQIGRKIGVQTRIVAAMSRNVPRMKRMTLTSRKIIHGDEVIADSILPVRSGTS